MRDRLAMCMKAMVSQVHNNDGKERRRRGVDLGKCLKTACDDDDDDGDGMNKFMLA